MAGSMGSLIPCFYSIGIIFINGMAKIVIFFKQAKKHYLCQKLILKKQCVITIYILPKCFTWQLFYLHRLRYCRNLYRISSIGLYQWRNYSCLFWWIRVGILLGYKPDFLGNGVFRSLCFRYRMAFQKAAYS